MGKINTSVDQDILDNSALPTLGQPFKERSFLFQDDCQLWKNFTSLHRALTLTPSSNTALKLASDSQFTICEKAKGPFCVLEQ